MPKERDVQTPSGTVYTADGVQREENVITVKEGENLVEKRARFARILDRGYANDRFFVDVPKEYHGEWVPNDYGEIERMKMLGFEDGSQYVAKRTMHHDGTRPSNADVVFMVQRMEDHELFTKMRQERFDAINQKGKARQKEEKDFATQLATLVNDVSGEQTNPIIAESSSRSIKV